MKIEVLLKEIRKEKRCKFATTFKNNRNFNIALELYRKEREKAFNFHSRKDFDCFKCRY